MLPLGFGTLQEESFKMEVTMRCKMLSALLAGLSVPLLVSTAALAAGEKTSISGLHLAQSSTETGQSGTGVRGTTGETSGGGQTAPGSIGTEPGGGSGATGTEGQPRGNGGAGGATIGQPPGGVENHVKEAVKHAEAAAAAGKKGDASTIANHARISKTHVEAALKEKPDNEHLKAALESLDEAIRDANLSMGDKARKASHEAITHLNAAK
jgi:hypothetical protein